MYTIKLMNEFLHGPIWIYDEDGFIRLKYPLIDNDELLQALNNEARLLYDSFYSFDEDNNPCNFDENGYSAAYSKMADIISRIVHRLNEINNDNFIIENHITD